MWQLQNFPGVGENYPVETKVELVEVDEETWAFSITKSYFSLGFLLPPQLRTSRNQSSPTLSFTKVFAQGHLKTTPSGTTLVVGSVTYSHALNIKVYVVWGIFLSVLVGGILTAFSNILVMIGVLVIVFAIPLIANRLLGLPIDDKRFANAMKGHIKGVLGN